MSDEAIESDISHLFEGLDDQARAALIAALMNEVRSLSIGLTHVLESLSPNVRKRVEVLRQIQGQHDELEAKFFEERVALEDKYQKLYQPLYAKRYDIVNGVGEAEGTTNEEDMDQKDDKDAEEKGVPDFWLTAMRNNEVLSNGITELDGGAFKYLKDIKWNRIDQPKGFKLEFYFDTNPYFKNTLLTKIYHMIDVGIPVLDKVIGTEIEWYPGKCLTHKVLEKKPMEGSKNAEPITKAEDSESFFHFFNSIEVPDVDEDIAEQLQNLMEEDYDVASTIRHKIIPHAVSWFTGEAIQMDEVEDDGNEGEDEDDDKEDDEEETKRKNKKSRRAQGDGQEGERPLECNH
ncbi:NUCLEOSOME/CHROMATIN ASSEMBLY FACTOR GROUP A 03, NUCLEOSOME/CHROMATIN ASSEMBLY FACTOR GROUP A3 [Hibiscus trionum]|uniref:NUCLEOSOME/CHROMATIN ASSEMBLY FACTOR GROUP A 03, NUCLEOSOME/CHROMATIN ASSEMBLY FACTOR GROUP A3 n=1 Tax=Hibiscus trionum TaxID=183268 RepID=A0A9W7IGL8_HIBTR|nr:NUCLEOSOME/CHROMATIN ASSEMBLY FACTOR GROUP A 03, NUCLEOSOME/CHROMATIN ASSEMBLY FACTOR GROUP A3 [Hibiscus trionum]